MRLRFDSMNYSLSAKPTTRWWTAITNIRELNRVLYEKDWYVISNDVPVAFLRIEFDSKTTDISHSVGAATAPLDGGEAEEDWCLSRCIGQDGCKGNILCAFEEGEFAKCSSSSSMNNTLRNPLMVEAMNLGRWLFDEEVDNPQNLPSPWPADLLADEVLCTFRLQFLASYPYC
jgi:hypothetical protein